MIAINISHERYYELHSQVVDPVLGAELGLFRKHFNCDVQLSNLRHGGRATIDLLFDSEEDAMWFKLKWM